ncbi:hypothetical protein K431DRAFT_285339 [Polychaeton citri CBS 116435]|uniref:Pex N-terminal domain-containing protein n=1 Tax=Polychaeton citri CBS 116435 TaxID=1314669 RepID=A0A9P4UM60_9PEZI|nr:hypothetical protein K431DRAFT_285339 [Polychaeton citri CBS 116435]
MADFAAAQRRVLERRAARAAVDQQTEAHQRQQASQTVDFLRLPASLRILGIESIMSLDTLRSPFGTRPAFRVGQVDAELLDEELLSLLKEQFGEGLRLFGTHLKDDWGAEIGLALRSILWKLSIWDHGASYGASLQGLKYIDARSSNTKSNPNATNPATKTQRALYGLLTVGGRYAWTRWEEHLTNQDTGYNEPSTLMKRLSRFTTLATTMHNCAAFVSFLLFLYSGRYRTLADRLVRLRLVPSSNKTSREVSFEYLNRQLVWHAFTEFLLFLLPLVGISRWRRWLGRAYKRFRKGLSQLTTRKTAEEFEDEEYLNAKQGELSFLPERTCAICYRDQNPTDGQSEQDMLASASGGGGVVGSAATDVTNPYQAEPCKCIYCFVCLAQKLEAEEGEGWTCLRCGEVVMECRPWDGDVLVPKVRTESGWSRVSEGEEGGIGVRRGVSKRRSVTFVGLREDRDETGSGHDEVDEGYVEGDQDGFMEKLAPRPVHDDDDNDEY